MVEPVGGLGSGLFDQGGPLGNGGEGMDILAGLQAEGINPLAFVQPFLEAEAEASLSSRPGAPIPGQTDSLRIKLSPADENLVARQHCDLLAEYDRAMEGRYRRDEEVYDAYSMKPDAARGGTGPGAAQMCSEFTMTLTDQSFARICTGVLGIDPIIKVDPIESEGFEGEEAAEQAKAAEQFLQSYCLYGPPDMQYKLPQALLRTTKVGNSVFYVEWVEKRRRRRFYPPSLDGGPSAPILKEESEGQIRVHLLKNRDVKVWPLDVVNWQDALFVAHEVLHTPLSWKGIATRFNLPEELQSLVSANPNDGLVQQQDDQRRHGAETSTLFTMKELEPVALTELWGEVVLPGDSEPTKVQMILHRPTETLIYLGHNPYYSQRLPYFPLRYKWSDDSAWATGVGHEVEFHQASDTAMLNLTLDNLMAGAYHVILRRPGSMYGTQTDALYPGAQLVVDDVEADFKSVKMGGEAPELAQSKLDNYQRARTASGLSSVASGQGDPVMKSGAGTGSVLALIDQGDKKLRMVDSNIRTDLSPLYAFFLELIGQYAPDGLFYQWASKPNAKVLKRMKYVPPRGDMAQMFRLRAQAPGLGASDEARKDRLLLIANLAQTHIGIIDGMVTELLAQSNPAALPRWKTTVIEYLTQIHLQVVELHEIPRLPDFVPQLPEVFPGDDQVNALMAEKQEIQAQLDQALQQLQQLAQTGMDMAQEGGEVPPEGMLHQEGGEGGPMMEMPMMGEMPMPMDGMPMMDEGGGNGVVA